MLKKPIKFEDFNGNERTEVHYFNLNKGELAKMELTLGEGEGFIESLKTIAREKDPKLIIKTFEDFIQRSYGVRSEDGEHFYKNERVLEQFMATPAYDALLLEMCTDAAAASLFINGVVPVSLQQTDEAIQEQIQKSPEELLAMLDKTPAEIARERSQAALQGHQQKQESAPQPQRVPDPLIQAPSIPTQPQFQPPVGPAEQTIGGEAGYPQYQPQTLIEQGTQVHQDALQDFQSRRAAIQREQGFLD